MDLQLFHGPLRCLQFDFFTRQISRFGNSCHSKAAMYLFSFAIKLWHTDDPVKPLKEAQDRAGTKQQHGDIHCTLYTSHSTPIHLYLCLCPRTFRRTNGHGQAPPAPHAVCTPVKKESYGKIMTPEIVLISYYTYRTHVFIDIFYYK